MLLRGIRAHIPTHPLDLSTPSIQEAKHGATRLHLDALHKLGEEVGRHVIGRAVDDFDSARVDSVTKPVVGEI